MEIAYLLPALACGAMMIGCMLMMSRMHGGHQRSEPADPDEVARLRDEVARLRAEHDARSPDRP